MEDLDRSAGRYFVRFVEPGEQEQGWFGWLFTGDDDSTDLTGNSYEIMVVSTEDTESVTITISAPPGYELAKGEAEKLLAVIKGNLS